MLIKSLPKTKKNNQQKTLPKTKKTTNQQKKHA